MITIPQRLKVKLEKDQALYGAVHSSLSSFHPWFSDNKTVFFPEYTDHGTTHLQEVIDTADSLITDDSWPPITANDSAAIIMSTLLHDCAMHLSEDGFYSLINGEYPAAESRYFESELIWSDAWLSFFAEAKRFDGKKLRELFGDDVPVRDIPKNKLDLTQRDKLLIGEFLRRHHAVLAHHIALNGIPGPRDSRVKLEAFDNDTLDLFGFIARSHNMGLRTAVDLLEYSKRRVHKNIHVPFIMGVLRISDYIQIHSTRADKQLLEIKSLSSPISKKEWKKHHAIKEIHHIHDDPEALYIDAEPKDPLVYEALLNLFNDIQKELDITWSILGEVYGRMDALKKLGINIRRVRSSLDSSKKFIKEKKPNFIPKTLKLKTSDSDMINLLISPLYGNKPGVGIRELMQNSVDACNELIDYYYKMGSGLNENSATNVTIRLSKQKNGNTITISDHGIGMTLSVIENYFLNIGASFRKSDLWKSIHETDGHSNVHRTGRFGIGLLAAYLLGDEIHVKTRHVSEQKGYQFSCRQDSDAIVVKPIEFHIGTEITIVINDEMYKNLKADSTYVESFYWDWYCLPNPKVTRIVANEIDEDETILEQKITVPMNGSDISDTNWKRTTHDNFDDILWSYMKLQDQYSSSISLICNGIKIRGYRSTFRLELGSNYPDMKIEKPTLIIYDQDGRMPLNLQRDALTTNALPFHDELLRDISRELSLKIIDKYKKIERSINKALIKDIIAPKINIIDDCHASNDGLSKLIIYKNKLAPFNSSLIKELRPKKILIDFVNFEGFSGSWQSPTLMSNVECYIPYSSRRASKSSKVNLIRQLFDNDSYRRGYFQDYPTLGKRIFIRKDEIINLVSPGNYPKTNWAKLKKEWENDKWQLLKIGHVPDSGHDYDKIGEELLKLSQPFFMEVYFDWEKDDKILDETIFPEVWKQIAGGILI
ncbi:HD domain-containing protein [Serratia bockelmannii]|uniref:HD domain-containing protein n=1 Tax=Serratia bockelmannii TaxID=2703793 RepID=UPI00247940F4|nr:ATP-binding protein [Serratia bockelmannii]MDH7588543.1 ATP-binding protein [Serratia bockelmannii]